MNQSAGDTRASVLSTTARETFAALMDAYARDSPVRTIAVVGNAPLTPDHRRAATIDACDLVIRVNGFALDAQDNSAVGRRVDVVVFNRGIRASPWLFDAYPRRLYLLVEPGRMHWEPETYPDWWPEDLGFVTVPNREVTISLARELNLDVLRDGLWATTGTTAAWIARWAFPEAELRLAGFSFVDNPGQSTWEHAYGEPCEISPEHRIAREGDLLSRWAREPGVTLLR